jgi:riboflavin kinase/FMN adenylyltransferase
VKLIRNLDDLPREFCSGAVTIGNFDGVHLGHARIIHRLKARAEAIQGPAVVFTFDPHPMALLRPEGAPPPLTQPERKAELLAALGVDAVVAYPTDMELLKLTAEQFFGRIIREQLAARVMVEGPNFYFGRDRAGDIQLLQKLTAAAGMEMEVVTPIELDQEFISSSRVRALVGRGEMAAANAMLTCPYRIRGRVAHGAGRGAGIGFPTANLEHIETLLPAQGVYAGIGHIEQESWPAAINIGGNPTFAENALKVEVHLAGLSRDIYDVELKVDILERLREIQPFDGVEALKSQLAADVACANEIAFRQRQPD